MRQAIAAIAVGGIFLAGAVPAWAVFPGDNGRIAYNVDSPGFMSLAIHTILPNGQGDRAITPASESTSSPFWSPRGRRIVFTAGPNVNAGEGNVYSMKADGSDKQLLAHHGSSPHYSPSGKRIVFDGSKGITTMHLDGSHKQVIGRGAIPTWAPTGKIAFIKGRVRNRRPSIWVMRPNGTRKHRLAVLGRFGGYGPVYTPNGRKFIFVRYGVVDHTLIADANGSRIRQPPCPVQFEGAIPNLPVSYSPDGRWLLLSMGDDPRAPSSYTLTRVLLSSCSAQQVVSRAASAIADWQAIPAP